MDGPQPAKPPAGWWPDPQNPALQRYWDGRQWTAHVAMRTEPVARTPAGPATTLATGTIWLAVANVALAFALLPFSWTAERSGASFPSLLTIASITTLMSTTVITGYVVTCLWLWAARRNVETLRPEAPQARDTDWIWAGWVVPVVALWFPFQIVRDIGSAPASAAGAGHRPPRMRLWWTLWLSCMVAWQVSAVLAFVAEPWAARLRFEAGLGVAVTSLAAALTWIPIVRHIDADQRTLLGLPSQPRRRRIPDIVAATIAGLGLTGTVALVALSPPLDDPGPRFEIPRIGECRTLAFDDLDHPASADQVVPCSDRHTTYTFDVGFVLGDVNDPSVYPCSVDRLDDVVGVDHRMTSVQYTYFVPTSQQQGNGAHWYRCDLFVTSGDSDTLIDLPHVPPLVSKPETSPYLLCDAADSSADPDADYVDRRIVMCSEPHSGIAAKVGQIDSGKKWPGEDAANRLANEACEEVLSSSDDYFSFSMPRAKTWKSSDRVDVICYVPDDEANQATGT